MHTLPFFHVLKSHIFGILSFPYVMGPYVLFQSALKECLLACQNAWSELTVV